MAQSHRGGSPTEALRLAGIERFGLTVFHCAEATMARANAAHDHECGRALGKTLADVWTPRFLTHGRKAKSPKRARRSHDRLAGGQTGLDPVGMSPCCHFSNAKSIAG
jgi:hypothetical protein